VKRELGESGENAAIFQSVLRVLQSARSAASTNEGRGVDIVKRVTGWSSQRVKIPMSVLTLKRSRPAAGSPITGASSASALRGVGESGVPVMILTESAAKALRRRFPVVSTVEGSNTMTALKGVGGPSLSVKTPIFA